VLSAEGLHALAAVPRRKRKEIVRRFERSKPGELWQTDITSYVLTRSRVRVYLTVFLDDFSCYVVSWQLATHQKSALVCEALMDGIERFGQPEEVLSDYGRQYFAWRGKADFQHLLVRGGIRHVVSRTHHPETLGKCERLWETVGVELWGRSARTTSASPTTGPTPR
jgi:transposase InsO family protein